MAGYPLATPQMLAPGEDISTLPEVANIDSAVDYLTKLRVGNPFCQIMPFPSAFVTWIFGDASNVYPVNLAQDGVVPDGSVMVRLVSQNAAFVSARGICRIPSGPSVSDGSMLIGPGDSGVWFACRGIRSLSVNSAGPNIVQGQFYIPAAKFQ